MADPTSSDRSRLQPLPLVPLADRERFSASLPRPLTSFVGREREVAEVVGLLGDPMVRLVTLTGPGGVGKTRMALAVAAELLPGFPDGVVFVGLAPVADPDLVLPTVGQALDVREGGDRPLVERLGALLGERHLLLVLDNLEHLAEAATDLARLLATCPRMRILVTSRAVLRLTGEQVFQVLPLARPDATQPLDLAEVAEQEAVALFVQRARAGDPSFALTAENAPTVAEIVRGVDGLPLAIELVAARVRSLTPAALLARLSNRLRLLTGGARDLPDRQRTMRDTIAWSHGLLTAEEQALFRRLAVFAGGCTLEAAEAVAGTGGQDSEGLGGGGEGTPRLLVPVLDLVGSLVDQSLLGRDAEPGREPRYVMLETVREYALDRLEASGEAEAMRARHAAYFTGRAEACGPYIWLQPDTGGTVGQLDAEQDNLRAALTWASEHDEGETFLRIAAALNSYWALGGLLVEGRTWLERALSVSENAPAPIRTAVVLACAWVARHQGDHGRARALGEEGLALAREQGDTTALAFALTLLGYVAEDQGRHARARVFHKEALALGRCLSEPAWAAFSMRNLGKQALFAGDHETAERELEEALALFQREGHRYGAAVVLSELGGIALDRGESARAAALWQERLGLAWEPQGLRYCLEGLARIAAARRMMGETARLLGAAEAERERQGMALYPRQVSSHERIVADARRALGEAAFAAAWAEGRRLSPFEARAEAVGVAEATAATSEPGTTPDDVNHGLTPRELEVLRLVADGSSDREIAKALFIGPATVRTHLANAFAKLEVGSRTAAVAAARRLGIL